MPTFTESSDERAVSISISTVVDAVDDLGMDPNGNSSISSTLNNQSGKVIEFPPGKYLITDIAGTGSGNLALVARDGPGTVTWKVAPGFNHWMFNWSGNSFVLDGIHMDMTASDAAGGIRAWPCSGDTLIRNVKWIGKAFKQNSGTVNMIQTAAKGSDTTVMLSNIVSKDNRLGDAYSPGGGTHSRQRVGVFTNAPANDTTAAHNGYVVLKDCDLREFANNATYMSRHHGDVQFEDCYFENNNVSAMRFSGPDSHARRCCVRIDASRLDQNPRNTGGGGENFRGTIIEQKRRFQKPGGTVIEDCEFIWESIASGFNSQGPLHVGPAGKSGVFRRCEVTNNTDSVPSIYVRGTGKWSSEIGTDRNWSLENCVFHGTASGNLDINNDRTVTIHDSCNDSNQPWSSLQDASLEGGNTSGSCGNLLSFCGSDGVDGGGSGDVLHNISFDTVHNAVDDLGMDPTGSDPIDDTLDSVYEAGTLVKFPPGVYKVARPHQWTSGIDGFGMVGTGSTRNDVEFVFPDGYSKQFIDVSGGTDHLFKRFTIQQTTDTTTRTSMRLRLADGLQVHKVELAGFMGRSDTMDTTAPGLIADITTASGVGTVSQFVCTDGGVIDTHPNRRVPIRLTPAHEGETRLVDCHIEEAGTTAVYASRTNGCVSVQGGHFKNNALAQMRIGTGHSDKVSSCVGASFHIDTSEASPHDTYDSAIRGAFTESGSSSSQSHNGHTRLLYEECDFLYEGAPVPSSAVLHDQTYGRAVYRFCRFEHNVDSDLAYVDEVNSGIPEPHRVLFRECSFVGDSSGAAVRSDRSTTTKLDTCYIDMPNGGDIVNCSNPSPGDSVNAEFPTMNDPSAFLDGTSQYTTPGDPTVEELLLAGQNKLALSGGSGDTILTYRFRVDGIIEPGDRANLSDNTDYYEITDPSDGEVGVTPSDQINQMEAGGNLGGGTDSWFFTADGNSVPLFEVPESVTVWLNGTEIDPQVLVDVTPTTTIEDPTTGSGPYQIEDGAYVFGGSFTLGRTDENMDTSDNIYD